MEQQGLTESKAIDMILSQFFSTASDPTSGNQSSILNVVLDRVTVLEQQMRDPEDKFDSQAFLFTNLAIALLQILDWFVRRWQIEVTFQEVRAHLGVETQRQWADLSIARTTPAKLAIVLTGDPSGTPSTKFTEVFDMTGSLVCQALTDIC